MKLIKGFGVYVIHNTINQKGYVGSTSKTFKIRFSQHRSVLGTGKHTNAHLSSAWAKYGADAFEFRILEVVDDPSRLLEREQYWMEQYQAGAGCYNLSPTSRPNVGRKLSDEHKRKVGEAFVRTYNVPLLAPDGTRYESITNLRVFCQEHGLHEATMRRMIIAKTIHNHHGWRRADEVPITREAAISRAVNARFQDPEVRAKAGRIAKAKMDDPDFKARCITAIHTPEAIERRRMTRIRTTYRFLAPDGVLHTFTDLRSFCQDHGLASGAMAQVHRGNTNLRSHKGWRKAP